MKIEPKPLLSIQQTRKANAILFAGWPEPGNIALNAINYIVQQVNPPVIDTISVKNMSSPVLLVKDSVGKLRYAPVCRFFQLKRESAYPDIYFFTGSVQFEDERDIKIANRVVKFISEKKINLVVTSSALPLSSPPDSSTPPIIGISNNVLYAKAILGSLAIPRIRNVELHGLNGGFLGIANEHDIPAICLTVPIPPYIPNNFAYIPGANIVAKNFCHLANFNIDFFDFDRDMAQFNFRMQKMQKDFSVFFEHIQETFKNMGVKIEGFSERTEDEQSEGAGGHTGHKRIPPEVFRKIENLFDEVKKDKTKAMWLKNLLDEWGLFERYEDQFLQMFEKKGGGREG